MTQVENKRAADVPLDVGLIRSIADEVNQLIDDEAKARGRRLSKFDERQLAMARCQDVIVRRGVGRGLRGEDMWSEADETQIRDEVINVMFGLGPFSRLIAERSDIENIYISGTRPVYVKYADGTVEKKPPIASTDDELLNLLRIIATHGGSTDRQLVSSRPILDLRFPDGQRGAVMWEVTPWPVVTIRIHRYVDITVEKLIGMGMVSRSMANFLLAAVRARRTILVVGVQGAGKTTLLRSLIQCIDRMERFATLETEYELFTHELYDIDESGNRVPRYPLMVPIEARPGNGEIGANGRPAGEMSVDDLFPASLRHDLKRLIVGEMRAEEILTTLRSMARGYSGSLASYHANSARQALTALRGDVSFYAKNVSDNAAMNMVVNSLDLVVYVEETQTVDGPVRYVREIFEVGDGLSADGGPVGQMIYEPDPALGETDPRGYPSHRPQDQRWPARAGLEPRWLDKAQGGWAHPFPMAVQL